VREGNVPEVTGDPPDELPDDDDAATPPPTPPAPGSLSLTPDLVRATPEFKAQERIARSEARKRGQLERDLAQARTDAETARAAAEAQSQAAREAEIRAILGDDGVAAWTEIADLSASDPAAAARKFREFGEAMAQSLVAAAPQAPPATPPPAPENGGITVPTGTPPPPSLGRTVGASAPLGQPAVQEGWDDIIATSQQTVDAIVKRNQDPLQRNRVTMRDRATGIMSYVAGAYAQHFKDQGRSTR
jgi:hypothetical protein